MRKLLFTIIITPLLILGCKTKDIAPKPKAEFTFTTDTKGGATFTNKSTDSNTYVWDFGDGMNDKTKDVSHVYTANKTYQVSLTVTGDGGTDVIIKSVPITELKGSIVFYTSYTASAFRSNPVVYIDGVLSGYINKDYSFQNPPDCGSQNVLTVSNLSEGSHKISIQLNNTFNDIINVSVNIIGGVCLKYKINP